MQRQFKIKVWRDRMPRMRFSDQPKWCWEVWERTNTGKVIGCGTTPSESASREAATRVVEGRQAELDRRLSHMDAFSQVYASWHGRPGALGR